jgi:hypothetical protein
MPPISDSKYIGIEDIRLFNFKDKIYYIGSTFDKSTNKIKITSNEFDLDKNYEINLINPTFKTDFDWEKNWVFFENNDELFIIYKWYPIQICKIDYNKKELNIVKELKTPNKFFNFRGSTNGVLFDNKIWFIIHSQNVINDKKHYFHRFVVWDKNWNIIKTSKIFSFLNGHIEFCAGVAVHGDQLLITFGFQDNSAFILEIPLSAVNNFIND